MSYCIFLYAVLKLFVRLRTGMSIRASVEQVVESKQSLKASLKLSDFSLQSSTKLSTTSVLAIPFAWALGFGSCFGQRMTTGRMLGRALGRT